MGQGAEARGLQAIGAGGLSQAGVEERGKHRVGCEEYFITKPQKSVCDPNWQKKDILRKYNVG